MDHEECAAKADGTGHDTAQADSLAEKECAEQCQDEGFDKEDCNGVGQWHFAHCGKEQACGSHDQKAAHQMQANFRGTGSMSAAEKEGDGKQQQHLDSEAEAENFHHRDIIRRRFGESVHDRSDKREGDHESDAKCSAVLHKGPIVLTQARHAARTVWLKSDARPC